MFERPAPHRREHATASGLGGLLETRYEHVDLGEHGEQRLRGRVRRRALRVALGHHRHLSIEVGQIRPVAIEVTSGQGRYDLPVPARIDPWARLIWRTALLWLASAVAIRLLRGRRNARQRDGSRRAREGVDQ